MTSTSFDRGFSIKTRIRLTRPRALQAWPALSPCKDAVLEAVARVLPKLVDDISSFCTHYRRDIFSFNLFFRSFICFFFNTPMATPTHKQARVFFNGMQLPSKHSAPSVCESLKAFRKERSSRWCPLSSNHGDCRGSASSPGMHFNNPALTQAVAKPLGRPPPSPPLPPGPRSRTSPPPAPKAGAGSRRRWSL